MNSETLHHAFTTFAKEAASWTTVFLLVTAFCAGAGRLAHRRLFLLGLVAGLAGGATVGFFLLPQGSPLRDLWVVGSLTVTALLLVGSVVAVSVDRGGPGNMPAGAWLALGAVLFFFDAGALGAALRDYFVTAPDARASVAGMALGGALCVLVPLALVDRFWRSLSWEGIWTRATLFLLLATVGIVAGGVEDFAAQDLLISLQLGLDDFVGQGMLALRRMLLLEPHSYLAIPWGAFLDYLGSDRISMSAMVTAVSFPAVWVLVRMLAAPDPRVDHLGVGAQRRKTLAFFRRDLLARTAPAFVAFLLIVVQVHAANLTLNPLFDPAPIPVVADEGGTGIRIPLEDRFGDFTDGRLRRYLYPYGDKKIVFIAMMKPDGTVKTCFDECEICEPAEWNKKARGYAQRGKNLVCKYCVTPISVHSVGEPGGCNPIPFPSSYDERFIYIDLGEFIANWKQVESMEKTGTHF